MSTSSPQDPERLTEPVHPPLRILSREKIEVLALTFPLVLVDIILARKTRLFDGICG